MLIETETHKDGQSMCGSHWLVLGGIKGCFPAKIISTNIPKIGATGIQTVLETSE